MRIPGGIILSALIFILCGTSVALAKPPKVSRQVKVTSEFQEEEIKWNGATGGYSFLMHLTHNNGIIEVCGVGVYTNGQLRVPTTQILRTMHLKMNGKTILSDFRFFAKARSKRTLRSTLANCASSGVRIPSKPAKFEIDARGMTFRG